MPLPAAIGFALNPWVITTAAAGLSMLPQVQDAVGKSFITPLKIGLVGEDSILDEDYEKGLVKIRNSKTGEEAWRRPTDDDARALGAKNTASLLQSWTQLDDRQRTRRRESLTDNFLSRKLGIQEDAIRIPVEVAQQQGQTLLGSTKMTTDASVRNTNTVVGGQKDVAEIGARRDLAVTDRHMESTDKATASAERIAMTNTRLGAYNAALTHGTNQQMLAAQHGIENRKLDMLENRQDMDRRRSMIQNIASMATGALL